MSKIFFTSDQHFTDTRYNLFYRPFSSQEEQNSVMINAWNSVVGVDDIVYHLGDFSTTLDGIQYVHKLNGTIHLIKGNYDDPIPNEVLEKNFASVQVEKIIEIDGRQILLNHYPEKASKDMFNIVGHIHGLWKVQRNMINVGCDAWHFKPVSEDEIKFAINAIEKFYDVNVFAGDLSANAPKTKVIYSNDSLRTKVFLAGPTPRDANTKSWRPEMIKTLEKYGFDGTIYVPERFNSTDYDYNTQVDWEDKALHDADIIVFWIPRKIDGMPGFTTNVEFGEWMKSGKCIVGYPPDAEKMDYIQHKCMQYQIPISGTMEDVAINVMTEIMARRISNKLKFA